MSGRALGVMDSQGACKYVNIPYDANTVTQAPVPVQTGGNQRQAACSGLGRRLHADAVEGR